MTDLKNTTPNFEKVNSNFEEPLDSIEEESIEEETVTVPRSTLKAFAWGALFGIVLIVLTLVVLFLFGFLYYQLEFNKKW